MYFREFFNSVHEDACIHNFTSDFGEKIDVIYKMSHFSFDNSFPIVMVAQKKSCTNAHTVAFGKQFPGRQLVICQIFHASKPLWKLAGKEAT